MTILALSFLAAAAPLAAAERAPARVTIPTGTPVTLTTVAPLDSRSAKQGQRFELRVTESVEASGVVVIPSGAPAVGEVEAVSAKGMVGKPGRLVLQPLFVTVAGERIYLTGRAQERGADATTEVAVGSLLLSGWGIFITGKSASIAPGTRIEARTRNDATVSLAQPDLTP
jgi:hypothetical protein